MNKLYLVCALASFSIAGCSKNVGGSSAPVAAAQVQFIDINQGNPLVVNTAQSMTFTIAGGTPPYFVSVMPLGLATVGLNGVSATLFAGVTPGTGTVEVTDSAGLSSSASLSVTAASILLFQNTSTWAVYGWLMSDLNESGSSYVSNNSSGVGLNGWTLIGAADLNGDGIPDLLWQKTDGTVGYWLMNSSVAIQSVGQIASTTGLVGWRLVGAVDLNGDGFPDLVWQKTDGSGAIGFWLMNGVNVVSTGSFTNGNSGLSDWHLVAMADLNGDGQPDLLWQQISTGYFGYWLMNGVTIVSVGSISSGTTGWRLAGAVDLNGDGHPDLLWQDKAGDVGYWLMNGVTPISGGKFPGTTAQAGATLVGGVSIP